MRRFLFATLLIVLLATVPPCAQAVPILGVTRALGGSGLLLTMLAASMLVTRKDETFQGRQEAGAPSA